MKKLYLFVVFGLLLCNAGLAQKPSYSESVEYIKRGASQFNKGLYELAEESLIKGLEGVQGEYQILEVYALGKLSDTQFKLGKRREAIENNNKAVDLRNQIKAKIDVRVDEISKNLEKSGMKAN